MKQLFIMIVLLFSVATSSCLYAGTKEDYQKSYNLQRGIELAENQNYSEARTYIEKEIADHPKNGLAYLTLALIQCQQDQYGAALESSNKAIKYTSSKDKEQLSMAHSTRAAIHQELGNEAEMLLDLEKAIKLQPESESLYETRAQYYYEQKQYELSDNDYNRYVELRPGDVVGYMGLGRNACAQGRYDDAIKQYEYVMKLSPNYSSAYSFRAQAYRKKGMYNEALEDCLTAIRQDYDQKAVYELRTTADSAFTLAEIKVKAQIKKNPTDAYWYYLMGSICQDAGKHQAATQNFRKAAEYDNDSRLLYWAALEAEEYGDYRLAIDLLTQVYERDTTDMFVLFMRGHIEESYGLVDQALKDFDTYIENNPEDANAYYQRGWLKDKNGLSIDEAIEDYTTSIGLDPSYTYNYLVRGQLYLRRGETEAAEKDFEMVLKQDTVFKDNDSPVRQYALFYLGRTEEAKAWQDSLLSCNTDKGQYYDAACLYSLLGETDQALEYLKTALDKGFCRFAHIRRDYDLRALREHPGYAALIEQYETKYQESIAQSTSDGGEHATGETVEVPFSKDCGVCKVNCSINGLPLYFVFDTGASDVSLSQVEANFMMKNNYLSSRDVSGTHYYQDATGNVSEGTVIVLREVDFGGVTLQNVRASVVRNQKAPLLLGQSVLSRLGRIEIDNENRVIKIQK